MSCPITVPAARNQASAVSRAGVGGVALLLAIHLVTGEPSGSRPAHQGLWPAKVRLRLDPNVATREELMLLPQIGPALSERIVTYRESLTTTPAFATADDLGKVRGIGPRTVAALWPHLRFEHDPPDKRQQHP